MDSRLHLPHGIVSERDNARSNLVFITTSSPAIKDAKTQTTIRKHVMRDIGKERRRSSRKKWNKPVQFELQFRPKFVPAQHTLLAASEVAVEEAASTKAIDLGTVAAEEPPYRDCKLWESTLSPQALSIARNECQNLLKTLHRSAVPNQNTFVSRFSAGRTDPFISYPIEMDHNSRALLDHVFNTEFDYLTAYRDAWFPVGLTGAAAFHIVLSNFALHLSLERSTALGSERYENQEALKHQAVTVHLLNKQISDRRRSTCDDTIGAILGLICYAHVKEDLRSWHAHMNGLRAILKLRGGAETLAGMLRLALFWIDVTGSSSQNTMPHFAMPEDLIPRLPPISKAITLSPTISQILLSWLTLFPENEEIAYILADLSKVAQVIKDELVRTKRKVYSDSEFSGGMLNPIIYRLLVVKTDSLLVESCPFHEALRLAMILFLGETRRRFGINPIISRIHVAKLRAALGFCEAESVWASLGFLKAWILTIGAIESSNLTDLAWFTRRLRDEWDICGASTRTNEKECLRKTLWIEDIHGPLYDALDF